VTVLARRSSLLLIFAVACSAIALTVITQRASAASYSSCSLTSKQKGSSSGYSTLVPGGYLYSLKVKNGPKCADAKDFVKAYAKCRSAGSKPWNGKCTTKSGYSCTEKRTGVISIRFNAESTCSKGSRRIYHRYQQTKTG
jgi:hypothetical protein